MDVFVSPGINYWGHFFPLIKKAVDNISNFVRDGVRYGVIRMLNTTWDDDNSNLFGAGMYPLVWGAECSWKPL